MIKIGAKWTGSEPKWGSPGHGWCGVGRTVDGNSTQDCGEIPSKLWDSDHRLTNSCSHSSCCRSDVKLRFFWQCCATYFAWFCLWPNRWETSWTCVLESSWGSAGPEGGLSAKIPYLFGKFTVTTQHRGDVSKMTWFMALLINDLPRYGPRCPWTKKTTTSSVVSKILFVLIYW